MMIDSGDRPVIAPLCVGFNEGEHRVINEVIVILKFNWKRNTHGTDPAP